MVNTITKPPLDPSPDWRNIKGVLLRQLAGRLRLTPALEGCPIKPCQGIPLLRPILNHVPTFPEPILINEGFIPEAISEATLIV
jgi:hypothetical protein